MDKKTKQLSTRRLERNDALKMIRRRCRQAGLSGWERLCNHTFRASGITDYLTKGGSIEYAQWQARHADPRTTKLYDRRTMEASLDEIERMQILVPSQKG